MKILFITPSDINKVFDGLNSYSSQMIESISKIHKLIVLSLSGETGSKGENNIEFININERKKKVGVRFLSIFTFLPSYALEFRKNNVLRKVTKIIESGIDAIIFNHRNTSWLSLAIVKKCNIPFIYISHNAEKESLLSLALLYKNPLMKAAVYLEAIKSGWLEKKVLKIVNITTAITEADKNCLRKLYPKAIINVVPIWSDISNTGIISKTGEKYKRLLYVGSLHWPPKRLNILWFLKNVFPALRAKYPKIELDIVGAGANNLQRSVQNIEGVNIFADVPEVKKYYKNPAIFVVPERQCGGLKTKTIEAASYGLPIVSTQEGIEGTMLQDGKDVLVANTREEFIEKISILISDNNFAQKLANNAQKKMKTEFNKERIKNLWIKSINNKSIF